ncbi:Na-translocating system protein MpsB [Aneurinibacillus sp. Ricciae_BoGa-3]|uniref:DUF2309 domain-containing protein n=1 Tax=Aneurinibacillus sp. Ricciae_BoGa-3 TaxID=3022697 RepID=UPI002341E711|nr:putative inorganic carbon transporter subunit DabA [Aneurinibacillus sp. Ricciae_BoGa-3]WCK54739.1 Na-translocating system protein MpsB [Aneurinibacillus sp. Ricciae_BoGa-3]
MIPTAQPVQVKKKSDFQIREIEQYVKSASEVIAPLGPIQTFAARHPWMRLERHSFEQVARRFKETCDVDIYPSDFVFHSAWNHGEIHMSFLEMGLQKWLDSQSVNLPRKVAEQFCLTALLNAPSSKLLTTPEVKRLAKRLNWFNPQITKPDVVRTYSQRLEQDGITEVASNLDRHCIKWCKLFLDESQAVWSMPQREKGFYQAWKRFVQFDPAISSGVRKQLKGLPSEADRALQEVLLKLEIPESNIQGYLEAHLLTMPGWAGMMLWRSQQNDQESSLLLEYLAVRICMEWAFLKRYLPLSKERTKEPLLLESLIAACVQWGDLPIHEWAKVSDSELKARLNLAYRFDKTVRNRLWLEAWEQTYEENVRKRITSGAHTETKPTPPALAQFVFCIDTRSESFRRHLEQAGPFETFGTAGFFGLPIETCTLGNQHTHNSLPVMFKPKHKVKEMSHDKEYNSYLQRQQAANSLSFTFDAMKHNMFTSLVLPEISGPWLCLQTLARCFVPRGIGISLRRLRKTWLRKPSTELTLSQIHTTGTELTIGFSEKEKVYYARQALKMMGLTERFAPLVVICGHGSHSTNNPYASSLDCGACGGTSSGFNARVLATLCNLPSVRQALKTEGIVIPDDTLFAAAEHITSLDTLRWLYVPALSPAAQEAFDQIESTMQKVSEKANAERLSRLPNIRTQLRNPNAEAERFAEDWSEIRPEWGLARNASFIIGSRALTRNCNLDGRTFLQTYDWKKDRTGTLLSNIITGPVTVAQWINLQYYASTVAPHYYGSGNKATQTVTSGIGVMQGNASDLLTGLPWQSVAQSDNEMYHEPLRLLVVIQAPRKYVERLLEQVPEFRQKVQNGWIRLACIEPEGNWESWS